MLLEIMKTKKKDERRAKEKIKNEIRGLGDWQKFPFGFFFSFKKKSFKALLVLK